MGKLESHMLREAEAIDHRIKYSLFVESQKSRKEIQSEDICGLLSRLSLTVNTLSMQYVTHLHSN